MKKITFLLALMLTLFGVSANAQVVFETSDAPTQEGWAANTKWYKMTLKNFYVSLLDADAEGNLYAKSSDGLMVNKLCGVLLAMQQMVTKSTTNVRVLTKYSG